MKVLMFGWEYPPHVFGGLATANFGISQGLHAQGDVETVLCLPHPFGDEDRSACRIVAMNCVPIAWRDVNYDYVKERVGNIMDPDYYYRLRDHIYADFNYMHVNDLGCMEFAGGYRIQITASGSVLNCRDNIRFSRCCSFAAQINFQLLFSVLSREQNDIRLFVVVDIGNFRFQNL